MEHTASSLCWTLEMIHLKHPKKPAVDVLHLYKRGETRAAVSGPPKAAAAAA